MAATIGSNKGFTLLEILVALTVLAITVAAAIKAGSSMVYNSIYLKERTLAHWVAMNQAAEMQLSRTWIQPGKSSGKTILANRRFQWIAQTKNTDDPDIRRSDIEVRSDEDQHGPLSSLVVFIGRPLR